MRVLITGSICDATTAAIEALARAGHAVTFAVVTRQHTPRAAFYFVTRYAEAKHRLPHPLEDAAGFERDLFDIIRTGSFDAVLPMMHHSALILSRRQKELEQYTRVPVPDEATFLRVHDKAALHRDCLDRGLETPFLYDYDNLASLRSLDIRFPVVVKPRRTAGMQGGLYCAADRIELLHAVEAIESQESSDTGMDDFSHPVIQEYIPGPTYDALLLYCRGQIRAEAVTWREHTYPVNGGYTVVGRTVCEPQILAYGRAVMDAIGWHGVCDVEMKRDTRDGRIKLIEVNPRFWGALRLAVSAGMNFPLKAAEVAATGDTVLQTEYREDRVLHLVLPRAVMAACQNRGQRMQHLLRLRALLQPNVVSDIRLRDPLPTLWSVARTIGIILRRRKLIMPDPFRSVTEAGATPER